MPSALARPFRPFSSPRLRVAALLVVAAATLAALAAPAPVAAAARPGIALDELFPGASFDPAIPTQEEVAGIRPGRTAAAPRRAAALPRGTGRRLSAGDDGRVLANPRGAADGLVRRQRRGDDRRSRRVPPGPRRATSIPRRRPAADDAAALEGAKAVAWMAYGIHGDELSSPDAAAAVAYRLVAGEDEQARKLRRELVVLIDPCENPDGRERFLAQTTAVRPRRAQPGHRGPLPHHRLALGPGQPLPVRPQPRLVQHGPAGEPRAPPSSPRGTRS